MVVASALSAVLVQGPLLSRRYVLPPTSMVSVEVLNAWGVVASAAIVIDMALSLPLILSVPVIKEWTVVPLTAVE